MELSLMDKFTDPALFDSLTMGEKAMGALITTCMGMGITFIVLILLWFVMNTMSKVATKTDDVVIKRDSVNLKPTISDTVENERVDDKELVAVISAAIAAYEATNGITSGNLVVRKITRISGNSWGSAGMADCLESRKIY